jgi:hypothetical protein
MYGRQQGRGITRPASHARPKGQQSASGSTHGAADALQVDVPTRDEHGVRNRHNNRITRIPARCPARVRYVDGEAGGQDHVMANPRIREHYSRDPGAFQKQPWERKFPTFPIGKAPYPCRIQLIPGSAVWDSPAGKWSAG